MSDKQASRPADSQAGILVSRQTSGSVGQRSSRQNIAMHSVSFDKAITVIVQSIKHCFIQLPGYSSYQLFAYAADSLATQPP